MRAKTKELILYLMEQDDKEWVIEEYKAKRSLSQNAYYWKLLELIAVKTHTPKAELHNINLRHLGLMERIDNQVVSILLPDTEETEKKTLTADTYHLAPTRKTQTGANGKPCRWYVMLRGSSDMNVAEMSALVDLAVQDAKALGIETLTYDELEHIRELERQHEQKHNAR